jgi:hypothetical protein
VEKAAAQQVELGAAEHLALQHLQPVDLSFDRTIAPGQCQRCPNRVDVTG